MTIIQMGIGFVLSSFFLLGFFVFSAHLSRKSRTKWYLPLKDNDCGYPSWEGVYKILTIDPLSFTGTQRELGNSEGIEISMFALIGLGAALLIVGVLIIFGNGASEEFNDFLSLSWIATFLYSAFALFIGIRAKVQSDNRMKWIDKFREDIVDALALAPGGDEAPTSPRRLRCSETAKASERARLRIETLLNPIEPDHRTLGLLIRRVHGVEVEELDEPVIQELDKIDEEFEYNQRLNIRLRHRCVGHDRDKLVMWAIRLSDAILKREWERVKVAG